MTTIGVPASVGDLLPAIRERRDEIERLRRMPEDLIAHMRASGLFRLSVPRVLGGAEADPLETLETIETIATADGSAGWCAMIGLSSNIAAGYMDESGARDVCADPTAPSAGIAAAAGGAVRVDGGVRVSGRWPFASGITHSNWVWAGCMVMENGRPIMTPQGPEIIHVWLPVSDVQIHDTWYVSGLSGTGSNDFSVDDAFVPSRRIFKLLDPRGHRAEPLYQMPPLTLFVFSVGAVSLGIARAALDEVTEIAQTKVPTLRTTVLADAPVTQIELARAEASLGSARAYLYEVVGDLWQTVNDGETPSDRQLSQGRLAAIHAVESAAAVTRTVNTLAGGSSVFAKSSLQRHARDAEAITHHFTVAPHVWEDAGRVLLGRKPAAAVF